MKISISFQNFDHTETLDTKIKEKSEKLNKYVGPSGHVHWHCYVKENKHYAEIKFGNTHAKANSDSLYKSIDMVLKKAEKQLVKQNEKKKNKIHRKTTEAKIMDVEQAWTDYDEDYFKDVA